MDEKISLEAISDYGNKYADKVLKDFFSSKNRINGQEILSLCNVQQVNLFVIRELFHAWKEETGKQKSAYFDYDHAEVKEALSAFMTVLSNHISIAEKHFAPLLKRAVSQTLMVIFNPYDFFSLLIAGNNNTLDVRSFREELKYLKVNRAPLEKMLHHLEERKVNEVPGNEAFAVLDQILEAVNFTPEDLDGYVKKFSQVVTLDPAAFFGARTEPPAQQAAPQPAPQKAAPVEKPAPRRNADQERTLNDTHTNRQSALVDSFRKIARIKENLTINQKFMFTKVLFYGDFESFSRVVDELDQLPDMNEALRYLEKHSSAWDRESREFHEFMEMVEMRFS